MVNSRQKVFRVADVAGTITAAQLSKALIDRFSPAAAKDFDGTVCLQLQANGSAHVERILFRIDHGHISAGSVSGAPALDHPDITLYFHSAGEALDLLRGSANPVAAFMDGRFRSDGYLLWVFAVLSMFRGS